ncbi:hypothetical protein [Paludibacterium yongneupense]|uniref:hypothetical protein n=1 Tax=Paludibacterium yongneupense TaxID=400061 RepID=UPI000405BDA3|nr:hypothetical protein [Paludibacterium yongneupense]
MAAQMDSGMYRPGGNPIIGSALQSVALPATAVAVPRAVISLDSGQLFTSALDVLFLFMDVMSQSGNEQFAKMGVKANVTRDAQAMANEVDAVMANMIKDDATGALPDTVYKYMKDNNVLVSGKTIDGYLTGKKMSSLNKGELKAIQSALESTSNRASDFVTQSQLLIQKVMQIYSQISNMISNMQTLMKDMMGTIISAIRS